MKRFLMGFVAAAIGVSATTVLFAQLEGLSGSDIRVQSCLFAPLDEPVISASKAGILTSVAREGDMFGDGDVVAQIDDREAQLGLEIAQYEFETAIQQANNDVDIRYAVAQKELTAEELREALEAVKLVAKAFSNSEIRQRRLNNKRSILAEEQAQRDHVIARSNAKAADAKVRAAKLDIELRKVRSTVDGQASEILSQAGEWVNPGDPIVRMLRLNRLKFEAFVDAKNWRQEDVKGRAVTIEITTPGNNVQQVESVISGVSYDIQANNEFRVWGEIDNPELPGGGYLVAPGMSAGMVIHIR